MNAQELLQEISDYCRHSGLAESTFGRRAVNDGKLTARLRNGGRITTETLDRIRAFMADQSHGAAPSRARDHRARRASRARAAVPAAPRRSPAGRARSAAQLPLLRQPAEVPAVRQHLQRKVGGRQPGRARARQHPSAPAGAARVRRRRGRRHRAAAGDARHARPLSAHAVLRRRQGDQPRGRAPRLAEDVGPLLRASGDRAGADQSRLCRRAVARGQVALRRLQHGLARSAADRRFRLSLRAADHRSGAVPVAELEGRGQPEDRQSGLRAAGGAGALSRGPQVPARPDHPAARRHGRQLRSRHRLAALPRARLARLQGQARDRAARQSARPGRAADRHPFPRQRSRHGDHPARYGRATIRSSTTATRS